MPKFEPIKLDKWKLYEMVIEKYNASSYVNYMKWCIERLEIDYRTLDWVIASGQIVTQRIYKVIKRRFPDLFDK